MQRIVFGILAVFFVQVGYQIYTAIDRTNYGYVRISAPGPRLTGVSPGIAETDDPATYSLSQNTVLSTPVKFRPATRRPNRPATTFASVRRPANAHPAPVMADFRPVVITIPPRPASAGSIAEKTAFNRSPQKSRTVKERRSFPEKALAVVKKPYDWLKAVASKLH